MGKLYLLKLLKLFGYKGLVLYRNLINPKKTQFAHPNYKYIFHFRKDTKDKDIFKHIILDSDYSFNFPNMSPKIIIDAGAYAGYSSVYFANRFKNATVICIEPDPDNFKILEKNILDYQNIYAYNKALWYKKTKLGIQNSNVNKISITLEETMKDSIIESITLNSIIEDFKIKKIDILKIDIEGAEKELFENTPHSWLSITNVLIIELHDRKKAGCSSAVFEAMLKYNFNTHVKGEYIIFIK